MLEIDKLNLSIGGTPILRDVSASVERGKILAIVGESGSGKSLTALSIMQLLPNGSRQSGSIRFEGHELIGADENLMQDLRGDDISMIFQEPMTALNPVKTIGHQIGEGYRLHTGANREDAAARAAELMERVGLPPARFPLTRYPHELSGGQRQRVMIAMACAQDPALLIADEPTTALDVTLQAQILGLLKSLVEEREMGLVLISHDLAVVAQMSDEIVIMRNGEVVDHGETGAMLTALRHPYTQQLAKASVHVPSSTRPPLLSKDAKAAGTEPLLTVRQVIRDYPLPRQKLFAPRPQFRAVDHVDLTLYPGQSVGLVGESGCGKSTLARMILALDKPTSGQITLKGRDLTGTDDGVLTAARQDMQVVFQDPFSSFNPRHKVERLVAEPLYLEKGLTNAQRRHRVVAALEEVAMDESALDRYPHEFSGGQRQRLAIARALITRPALIVADEPVSALDVSIRAQVLDLFADLRDRLGLTYLFISHDLGVVRAICDEVLVMESGGIVERGPVNQVFDAPQSDAAKRLVAATPDLQKALHARRKPVPKELKR